MKTNQDQIHLSSWIENLKFHWFRGKDNIFRYLLNRIIWHYFPRFNLLTKFPEHVDIELSSACNLRCPMCYTITDAFKKNVKRTNMSFEIAKKVIDECVENGVYSIRLSWRGELTLNQNWIEIVKYAKSKGIKEISTLTNALLLTPEKFKMMLDAGLDWLTISVDGVGETYNKIRAPAKFDDLICKLKKFKEIKNSRKTAKPVIKVQTIWPAIEENPDEYFKVFRPLVDQVTCNQLLDYLHEDIEETIVRADKFDCFVLYQRMTVGADGRVLLCYNDELDSHILGDIKKGDKLKDIWKGTEMQKARNLHKKHIGVETIKACAKCFLPREHESYKTVKLKDRGDVKINKVINREQKIGISVKF
jgi:radical SAM protein with 4Fe4S-binding SPASM domain